MNQTHVNASTNADVAPAYKILIISSIVEDWGGSEELWAQSIPFLQDAGFQIAVMKNKLNFNHPKFSSLAEKGVSLYEVSPKPAVKSQLLNTVDRLYKKIARRLLKGEEVVWPFTQKLLAINPDFVLISQGMNFDGLGMAFQCSKHNYPYVVLAQKAVDFYWPEFYNRPHMIHAMQHAARCYFVSKHNLILTEEQFGLRLSNAQVVHNPVKISSGIISYPSTESGYKFACIGRLFILDKGQDILLRILAQPKWKDRPVTVSFIGTGGDTEGLQAMAKLLGIDKVEFIGHVDNIENMWRNYHALVLPSRSEGLPLAMIEAMAAGRTVIVSNAGGNAEVIEEGINGFIGNATVESFDDAMERAWSRREEWASIGAIASDYVSKNIPKSPEKKFAQNIIEIFQKMKLISKVRK